MNIKELKQRREQYGHDERAINKHSVRVYHASGAKRKGAMQPLEFHLNRTMDGCPPFYSLYYYKPVSALPSHLTVNGAQYWGGGFSWSKAEQQAFRAIEAFMEAKR